MEDHIDYYQNSAIGGSALQERPISRIGPKLTGLDHVVALIPQPFSQTAAHTSIYQESHEPAIDTAARVSLAITACA